MGLVEFSYPNVHPYRTLIRVSGSKVDLIETDVPLSTIDSTIIETYAQRINRLTISEIFVIRIRVYR